MLNISENRVSKYIDTDQYQTLKTVESKRSNKVFRRTIYWTMGIILLIMFLPWTQNIRSNGEITTLKPNQRPQSLNAIIPGRIERWFVQEGDFVEEGDTILKISEIKDAYFDDQLLNRTAAQVKLKGESIEAYQDKVEAQQEQMTLVQEQQELKLSQIQVKLQQARLRVQNDSIAYEAAKVGKAVADYQYKRQDSLYQLGLKSLTDLESRNIKKQEATSKEIEARNKWLNSQNDLIDLQLEASNTRAKFNADLNKIRSEQLSTLSEKLDAETNLQKLENQYSNYLFRNGLYFITAPQAGYITKVTSSGIGETLKEGDEILKLMPEDTQLAVAMYVEPIDLPLVEVGREVRIQFDGWPAIVFSGWPDASHGTYAGKVYAMDRFISANGKYRILVAPDPEQEPWPDALRFGSGTSNMMLLQDVPIWYELWRKVNGFPPDFYQDDEKPLIKPKK